jgi:hypothetical protein
MLGGSDEHSQRFVGVSREPVGAGMRGAGVRYRLPPSNIHLLRYDRCCLSLLSDRAAELKTEFIFIIASITLKDLFQISYSESVTHDPGPSFMTDRVLSASRFQ